jgi:hypothetical protein
MWVILQDKARIRVTCAIWREVIVEIEHLSLLFFLTVERIEHL